MNSSQTVYDAVGGAPTFQRLVDAFYARVEQDPLLRRLFPDDLEPGKQHQYLFLIQYFGGPQSYSESRGHPRLRMRHAPYSIGAAERDAWLQHMLDAIDEVGIAEPARSTMRAYFSSAATAMVNRMT
jgi:hemoglobin